MKSAAKRTSPPSSTRRLVEIHDIPLRRGTRIDGEMRAAGQALIGADIAEGVAVGERDAFRDLQLDPVGHAHPTVPPAGLCGGVVRATRVASAVGLD